MKKIEIRDSKAKQLMQHLTLIQRHSYELNDAAKVMKWSENFSPLSKNSEIRWTIFALYKIILWIVHFTLNLQQVTGV